MYLLGGVRREGMCAVRRTTDFNNLTQCQSRIIFAQVGLDSSASVVEPCRTLQIREIPRDSAFFSDGYQWIIRALKGRRGRL